MKYPKEIQCPVCKETRLVDYRNVNKIVRGEISARCFKCSRLKKGECNSSGFKKGMVAWNKGTHGLMPEPWNKNLKGFRTGEKNNMWKGEDASYFAKHIWLKTNFGSANCCENPNCKGRSKNYHWALKKGYKYEHKRENFMMLCVSCHRLYDYGTIKILLETSNNQII